MDLTVAKADLQKELQLCQGVRGEDDLLLCFVERIERVEELFLRPLLAGEKLDVVEKERVDGAITIAE